MTSPPNNYDVARTAGVSRTVVSLVLNGKADRYGIARKTQDRVRAVIRQTGLCGGGELVRAVFAGTPSVVPAQGRPQR